MTVVGDGFSVGQGLRPLPRPIQGAWRAIAFQRLDNALDTAVPVAYDDNSRIIFFSDLHRGDNSPADAFAKNKSIYQAAMTHYWNSGFTYVEVGDGDELWLNGRFSDIVEAHHDVFELLHCFDDAKRLYLLIGNHDTYNAFRHQDNKDGIATNHSLLLTHRHTHQPLLVIHGHQADMTSSRYYTLSRVLARSLGRWAQGLDRALASGIPYPAFEAGPQTTRGRFAGHGRRIEQRIVEWIEHRQMPVVCGHTHLASLPGRTMPPYFNSGSCVSNGFITGLELEGGELTLVKWSLGQDGRPRRQHLAQPSPLLQTASAAPVVYPG